MLWQEDDRHPKLRMEPLGARLRMPTSPITDRMSRPTTHLATARAAEPLWAQAAHLVASVTTSLCKPERAEVKSNETRCPCLVRCLIAEPYYALLPSPQLQEDEKKMRKSRLAGLRLLSIPVGPTGRVLCIVYDRKYVPSLSCSDFHPA